MEDGRIGWNGLLAVKSAVEESKEGVAFAPIHHHREVAQPVREVVFKKSLAIPSLAEVVTKFLKLFLHFVKG